MAVNIPQVITPDSASGALVIDGCLKFDTNKGQYLKFTPSTTGNRRTQTLSVWIKNTYRDSVNKVILGGGDNASGPRHNIYYAPTKRFGVTQNPTGSQNDAAVSVAQFRDFSGWQHLVVSLDCTLGQDKAQVRIYVNGKLQENGDFAGGGAPAYITDQDGIFNTINKRMYLGHYAANPSDPAEFDGYMSQYYWIDGLALGPEYFAYEDPLTNTWRPKKFRAEGTTVNDGTEWSSGASGFASNASHGFNGNATNYSNSGADGATYTLPKAISGRLFIKASTAQPNDGTTTATITLSDGTSRSTTVGYNNNGEFLDFGEVSNITTISDDGSADNQGVLYWVVQLDGVVMKDSTTQNLDFGTNGVYLPFDGLSPIGQDKSGKGNDYTPVNFGGSNSIEKATGAFPILNTLGGTTARPGVFGSDVGFRETVSSSSGGGNPYIFDGRGTQPVLSFIRGATYVFDYSSATSHPLRFATAADAAGSTEYTDGTSVSGNVISFTVPHNAPDTLYYYCTNHSGMGNSISVTTDEKKADPYAWKNVLAMPLVGISSDISNNLNVGSTTKTITVNGNTAASSGQSNFYNGSFAFDGTGDFLRTTVTGGLGDGDFTVEWWYYRTASSGMIFNNRTNGDNSDGFDVSHELGTTTSGTVLFSAATVPTDKWVHVAYVRNSGTFKRYVDGVENGSISNSTNFSGTTFSIGGNNQSSGNVGYLTGYMQDIRIYVGVAKYTSNFIPASSNPDILPDTPSGVAIKSQLTKITDGAVSFDGSGDYLSGFGGGALLPTSTGTAFVVDCFWSSSGNSSQKGIWEQHSGGSGRTAYFVNSGTASFISEGNTVGSFSYADNRWYFTRIIYDGSGNIYHYVDGVLIGSGTQTVGVDNTGFQIGAYSTDCFNGHISNFRIVVGSNSLSGTDIPTSPLTNITNTTLLCCQSNTSATAAAVTPGTITANGNTAATNFNPFTDDINAIRGQESGYCTWNPLTKSRGNLLEGNFLFYGDGTNTPRINGTISQSSGKWYYEATVLNDGPGTGSGDVHNSIGWGLDTVSNIETAPNTGAMEHSFYFMDSGWYKNFSGSNTNSNTGKWLTGDVIGVAADLDSNVLTFFKNGIEMLSQTIGTTAGTSLCPAHQSNTGNYGRSISNFGQKPFKFPPPDGFQPLTSSTSRPDTVIARPDQYMNTVIYTGTGADLTLDVGFKPDFSYFARRNSTGYIKYLFDSVRGPTKYLATSHSQGDDGEGTSASTLKSFDYKGVTIGNNGQVNESSAGTYVSWHWKAGGAPTATNDNTSGAMDANSVSIDGVLQSAYTPAGSPSIYPKKMSIGTKQGFSIIQWTDANNAQTLPHGLSQAPDLILIKDLGTEVNWSVYHSALGNANALYLNTSAAQFSTSRWNSTTPTANVFSWNDNTSTNDQIAYCWHNVPGLQKFGSYTATGTTNGPFVELGFRPALIWIKNSDLAGEEWVMYDNRRGTYNPNGATLTINTNAAEYDGNSATGANSRNVDFLSNGFKINDIGNPINYGSRTDTHIYCAWAESPTFNLFGASANAR